MKKFSKNDAGNIGNSLSIDWNEVSLDEFTKGINIEMEHGKQYAETNVTNDDELLTGKIAWAHLKEFPDYYTRLEKMEREAEAYWENKPKSSTNTNDMINTNTTVHIIVDKATTENDFELALTQMKEITKKIGYFNLIIEVEDVSDAKKIKNASSFFDLKWFSIKNLRKYAIVSDKDWIENLIPFANFLTPGIAMKEFDEDEIQDAIDWINAPTKNEEHGLAIVPDANYLHLLIYDTLTKADYTFLNKNLEQRQQPTAMLVEMRDFEGFTAKALWEDIKMGISSYSKFDKAALVTNKKVKGLVKAADFVTPGLDLKVFTNDERDTAIEWVTQ